MIDDRPYHVEYSRTGRARCKVCGDLIAQDVLRIATVVQSSGFDGKIKEWHHTDCFFQEHRPKATGDFAHFDNIRWKDQEFIKQKIEQRGTSEAGSSSSTASTISESSDRKRSKDMTAETEDQDAVKKVPPKIKEEDVPPEAKKIKPEDDKEEKNLKIQQVKLFAVRDKLASLKKKELIEMLEHNEQKVPSGQNEILDALADAVLFGALEPCPLCRGELKFESGTGYKCTKVLEWASCEYMTINPKRKKFDIPEELKEKHPFLNDFELQVERRLIKITKPSTPCVEKKEDVTDGPKTQAEPPPLKYFTFVLAGFSEEKAEKLTKEIVSLGGTMKYKVTEYTTAVIATRDEVEKLSSVIEDARDVNVHVVSEDFVEEAKHLTHGIYSLFKQKSIADWGDWPMLRVINAVCKGYVPKDTSDYVSSGKKKLIVKGAGVVDIVSGLTENAHVYQRGEDKFTISLAKVDAQANKNSFYKMQILEHDNKEEYWLFRKWGRTGTTIGDSKCDKMSRDECIEEFESLFWNKTGNSWWDHKNCPKEPGKWYPIPDVDESDDNSKLELLEFKIESGLKKPVQDLMRLIFSVDLMKKAMLEYEIDMDKMPLGKISKTQIKEANLILSELLTLIQNGVQDRTKFIKASNRFYTLIPHNFGVGSSNIIDTEKQVQAKSEMLEALSKMEIAYNLLQYKTDAKQNPLDTHYQQLNTKIDVLDHASDEFKLIELYVKNTHGQFHDKYELVVEEVFTVKRDGEESRYEPFKDFPNRKLLWHGSRVTNFAGILSQGLRIAPPEAPSTGSDMFGKGIYFADMVSKSANYCKPSPENTTGLLLLCEVALGKMYELLVAAPDLEKSPDDYHSVWGRGPTQPDPEKSVKLETGVEVPCGPLVPVDLKSKLLHNEFIVYDVDQVKIEFMVKLRFVYKKTCKK